MEQEIEPQKGPLEAFRERRISLATMDGPLRLVTGIAVAQLAVAAILLTIRDSPMPTLAVYVVKGELVSMPIPTFVVAILLFSLSWAYLLAGIAHARLAVRILGMLGFLPLFLLGHEGISALGTVGALGDFAILGLIVLVATLAIFNDSRRSRRCNAEQTHLHRLRILTFLLFFVLVLFRYLLAWYSSQGSAPQLFTSFFTLELFLLSFFLIPLLFLAGADFAEWGDVTSGQVALLAGRLRPPVVIAVVGAGAAGLALFNLVAHNRARFLPQLTMAAVVAALILVVVRVGRLGSPRRRARVPYAALVLAALLSLLPIDFYRGIQAFAGYQQMRTGSKQQKLFTGALVAYTHQAVPTFSIGKPPRWELHVGQEGGPTTVGTFDFSGSSSGDPARFLVISFPTSAVNDEVSAVTAYLLAFTGPNGALPGRLAFLTSSMRSGPWRVSDVTVISRDGIIKDRGRIWSRMEGSRLWLMLGITAEEGDNYDGVYRLNSPVFDAMAESWKPEAAAAREAPKSAAGGAVTDLDRENTLVGAVWLVVLLVALGMIALAARRRPQATSAGLVFLAVVGAISALSNPASAAALLFKTDPRAFTGLLITGIQELVALATVALVFVLLVRRRLTAQYVVPLGLLVTLIGGLQVISWIYDLYNQASDISGRFNVAQAGVMMLALLWDVTMSGESITNRGGRLFPRHARVLMFLGYVTLVATVLMYFSSLRNQAGGASVQPQFESERWPQQGLVDLGAPLLVTFFTIRMAAWWDAHRRPTVAETPAGPGPASP